MSVDQAQDVMQVCLRGHVITDRLRGRPEHALSRCDRCGAPTLHACPTCGRELPGARAVLGLEPVGRLSAPPHCPLCGAAFPWAPRPARSPDVLAILDRLLRRLPQVVRQLRVRHDGRPSFRVEDVYDLADLVRALLPLHFDDVRPEGRTPSYASRTRTDFVLAPEQTAVTVRRVAHAKDEAELTGQLAEDMDYYERRDGVRRLLVLVYDPEQHLPDPARFEAACRRDDELTVRCVVAW
ncbi:MAG: DUF2321 domain-containing protein [Gemmataceae bacterium]|nr:DUF2321 domain-containing protein [Gemmataceae bacterium]